MPKKPFKLTEAQELWISCLEEDDLPQTEGTLQDAEGYCCLGVACFLYEQYHDKPLVGRKKGLFAGLTLHSYEYLNPVLDWIGLRSGAGVPRNWAYDALTELNDNTSVGFKGIAKVLRKHPEQYFVNPDEQET